MARDEDDFRIRPGKVGDHGGGRATAHRIGAPRGRPTSFVGEVHRAIRRAGCNPNRDPSTGKGDGRFNARGRGAATALTLKDRGAWSRDGSGTRARARRVAVKARVVKLNPQRGAARGRQFVGAKAVDAHLRYLERDGVTKDGAKGQVYSAERDVEAGRAFLNRGREDRHQFRFIVSAAAPIPRLSQSRSQTAPRPDASIPRPRSPQQPAHANPCCKAFPSHPPDSVAKMESAFRLQENPLRLAF
jgi:hypothetical protein